uniref:Uncharacterized protein n=1 Tax=Arundo donax TaxID=35708 RepID=A0A0A9B138_ARUDO
MPLSTTLPNRNNNQAQQIDIPTGSRQSTVTDETLNESMLNRKLEHIIVKYLSSDNRSISA